MRICPEGSTYFALPARSLLPGLECCGLGPDETSRARAQSKTIRKRQVESSLTCKMRFRSVFLRPSITKNEPLPDVHSGVGLKWNFFQRCWEVRPLQSGRACWTRKHLSSVVILDAPY